MDSIGPSCHGMQQLLACLFHDGSNGLFCHAVLKVGIDPTVGNSLLLCGVVVDECVVGKTAVVGVVVLDSDMMVCRELFKRVLCSECLVAAEVEHEMIISEAGIVVDKDGCRLVSLYG